jgi:hypothetical protein
MENTITAVATGLLVLVGVAQAGILIAQKRQARLALISEYWKRWNECRDNWGRVVFVGRCQNEYYQVLGRNDVAELRRQLGEENLESPAIWALDSMRAVCGILGDVSMRILQRQLNVSDAYPVFGTELLRHSRPLRKILDSLYKDEYFDDDIHDHHLSVRRELQVWLIYHDGLRRRCLILLDLLWAEAVRLEDLAPSDIATAAEAKKRTGASNRARVFLETLRLNGLWHLGFAWRLSRFLRHSEYKSICNWMGISKSRLSKLDSKWTERLLHDRIK